MHSQKGYTIGKHIILFGSVCHPLGNPIAAGSTTGYFESKALMSFVKVLAGLMELMYSIKKRSPGLLHSP